MYVFYIYFPVKCFHIFADKSWEKEEKCKSWLAKNLLAFLSLDNDDKNYEITDKYYDYSELENLILKQRVKKQLPQ